MPRGGGRSPLYTEEELEQIRRGEVPEGRNRHAVLCKARELGIIFPRIIKNKWSAKEIRLLKENKLVPTRGLHACYTKAAKLKISYCPNGVSFKPQHEIRVKHEAEIIEELKSNGGKIRATGRKFGLSYATISYIAKREGITSNPSPKERKGSCIYWGGSCWVWCVRTGKRSCSYWRETSGKRRNLARVIWEKANGPIPPRHVIVFKNGDRMDLRVENLEMISNSDFARRQQEDPLFKAASLAGGALGRLNKKIRRELDPEYDKMIHDQCAKRALQMQAKRWEKKTA